jgi:hypothetical protein
MLDAATLIERPQAEIGALVDAGEITPVVPYWDIVLRKSRSKRLQLFRDLMRVGLVGLRLRIEARASLFFVAKKDGSLRLVDSEAP